MYSKGSVSESAAKDRKGYFIGAFIPEGDPRHSEKVEVALMRPDSTTKGDRHFHEEMDEIVIVLKGRLWDEVDGVLLEIGPGGYLFIKAGATTEVKGAEEGTEMIVIKAPSIPTDKHVVPHEGPTSQMS